MTPKNSKTNYAVFLDKKSQFGGGNGFSPMFMPDALFDFQSFLQYIDIIRHSPDNILLFSENFRIIVWNAIPPQA